MLAALNILYGTSALVNFLEGKSYFQDVPALGHEEEDGPSDDPELQYDAGPVEKRVVVKAVEEVRGSYRDGSSICREVDVNMTAIARSSDNHHYTVIKSFLIALGDDTTHGESDGGQLWYLASVW